MAKLSRPLLSQSASGNFGKKLIYSMRNNISQVRNFHYPKKEPTGKQLSQRYLVGLLNARWQTMTTDEKAPFISGAVAESARTGKPLTGFNYWIKTAISDLPTYYKMKLFFPMNEICGNVIKDYSGNGLDFTFSPLPPSAVLQHKPSENKKFGLCLESDAVNKVAIRATSTKLDYTEKISFAGWVRCDKKDGALRFLFYSSMRYNVYIDTPNTLICNIYTSTGQKYVTLTSAEFPIGQWIHICFTFDSTLATNNLKVFKNGKFVRATTTTGTGLPTNSQLVFFGYGANYRMFAGAMDNFIIVDRVFSALEVQKIYELMFIGKERQNLN